MPPSPRTDSLLAERRWPTVMLSLLLMAQAAAWFSLGSRFFMQLTLVTVAADWQKNLLAVLESSAFNVLAVLALGAAIGFARRHPWALVCGFTTQGLSLLLALEQYARGPSSLMYLVMLYCIGLVIYLNYAQTQLAAPQAAALNERIDA